MKGKLKVMDGSGHTEVVYDTEAGVVEEAEEILARAAMQSAVLFDAKTKEKVAAGRDIGKGALEEHEDLLVVPPLQGG